VSFRKQSIFDPWPADWTGTFDLVHQRLILNALDGKASQSVVESLFALVKPGGWIQLLEIDHSAFASRESENHPALVEFSEVYLKLRLLAGKEQQPARLLRKWLVDLQAVDVMETILDCPVGKKASDEQMQRNTIKNILMATRQMDKNKQSKYCLDPKSDI
jgi:gliotoxin biosynthesis N-methyltransferase